MQYELFYLIGASKEAELENIRSEVNKIITENEGEFSEKETLEKRRLAYEIRREGHGIYVAQRFGLAKIENLAKINRRLNLHSGVLRFIMSKASDLPELKSKEERINEQKKKEVEAQKFREREVQKKSTAFEKKQEKPEKKTPKVQEDIDKKLEEILNI